MPRSIVLSGSDRPPALYDPEAELGRQLGSAKKLTGGLLLCALTLGMVLQLTSAVSAAADIAVASKVKTITHPTGGVLSAVLVHDGDRVRRGQVLMRFDTAVAGVNAEMSGKTFEEMLAMQARLAAERDGSSVIQFPADLATSPSPTARLAVTSERRLFELRRDARNSQQAELSSRVKQAQHQIDSDSDQIAALHRQSDLIGPEREGMEMLYAKKLTTLARVNQLKRTEISLTSDAAALEGDMARLRAQISELRQQMVQLDQDARSQAGSQLADVTAKVSEQQLRKASAADTLDRTTIRAPQDGVVDKLAYITTGSFVPSTQPILQIVPDKDRMTVDARVSPADIDEVHPGQTASLRFTGLPGNITPQIEGRVRMTTAERQTDERTGASFYRVTIDIVPAEIKRLGGVALVPGMPVEAFIQTGRRSMLSYLIKPLVDQIQRSFRQS